MEGYRKFCNKIFNATKFAMLKLDEAFTPELKAKPTSNESLVENWVLHRLNIATAEINRHLAERNFMSATSSAYNFWLYELCDVYIVRLEFMTIFRMNLTSLQEAMKPMTDESAPLSVKRSAQQTLYTCLDHGLRLLHPFMPFVTEELWQRLPRRPNDPTPSIMVSAFPEHVGHFIQLCQLLTTRTYRIPLSCSTRRTSSLTLYLLQSKPAGRWLLLTVFRATSNVGIVCFR